MVVEWFRISESLGKMRQKRIDSSPAVGGDLSIDSGDRFLDVGDRAIFDLAAGAV